jgi:hypothetical protein
MVTTRPRITRRQGPEVMLLTLTPDGRLRDEALIPRVLEAGRSATDCFVVCHAGPLDDGEVRGETARLFALLDQGLAPLRDRVTPLRVALHWPVPEIRERKGTPLRRPSVEAAGLVPTGLSAALARRLCEAEVPEGPEEEAELEVLRHRLRAEGAATALAPAAAAHLRLWLMKRRAGQVGARFGREYLNTLTGCVRTHLVGHASGGKLAASAVLAGARPESLTLLLASFSAFAFAPAVPGSTRPGMYHALVTQRRVERPIIVLRSDRRATGSLSGLATSGREVARSAAPGRAGHARTIVATRSIGLVGARGVGAPELTLEEVQRAGLPQYPVVNVDGSARVNAADPLDSTHSAICRPDIATLILLAGGLLQGGPDGIRPPRLDPLLGA